MKYGILIKETMSGWAEINNSKKDFSFSINAYTAEALNFGAVREVHGSASIGNEKNIAVSGELTLKTTGPRYELALQTKEYGVLEFVGEKTYSLKALSKSLTTCPMSVYSNSRVIGTAEVMYLDPMWKFPLKALRICKEEDAFTTAQG